MILNRIHDALGGIHAEEELKLKTKEVLFEKIARSEPSKTRRFSAVRFAIAAFCLAILVAGGGGYRLYSVPVYAISIDVNPSLELGVNRFDRVVSVTGYNDDGDELARNVDVKNMNYTDAINALLSSETLKEYSENGADVVVAVSGGSEQKNSEIVSAVEGCHHGNMRLYCYGSDSEMVEEAHENGLSLGKYRAYLELKQYDPNITVEDIRDMPMYEIRNMIREFSGDQYAQSDEATETGCGQGQSGAGYGYGHGYGYGDGNGSGNGNGTGNGNGSGGSGNGGGQHHRHGSGYED